MIKNKKGFTLIELMIVMAIIGILAVVALVAIAGKSVDARDARRLSDASSIQLTFALHAIEHGSDYLEGGWPGVLLNDLGNKADIVDMMDLDGVTDPIATRTDICYDGMDAVVQCNQAGGYTVFDIYDDMADLYLGTFDNYAIGIKLESTESIAYFENFDWRKFVGITPAHAAGCGDAMCAYWLGENMTNCPADCYCGDFYCVIDDGETAGNCPADCFCEDSVCDASEDEVSCYYDCGTHTCGDAFCYTPTEVNGVCPADCACDLNGTCDGGETVSTCADDCSICNNNGFCEIPTENPLNCPADCSGGFSCGDGDCNFPMETPMSCPADCGGGGGGETDENDWLYIGPAGVMRSPYNGVDLYDYTYSE